MPNPNTRSQLTKAFTFVNLKGIPGPRHWAFYQYTKFFQKDILGAFTQVHHDYGDIGSFPWPMNSVIIYSPEMIKRVLVDQNKKYIKGEQIEELRAVVGNGLATNNDHSSWVRNRSIVSKEFNSKAIQLTVTEIHNLIAEKIKNWENQNELIIDICEEMKHLTFVIACQIFLGKRFSDEEANKVNEAVHYTSIVTYQRIFQIFPLPYWLPTNKNKTFNEHFDFLNNLVLNLIKEEQNKGLNSKPKSILERLVHAIDDETKTKLTSDELRDEVLTMMLAGHETSAHSLAWTLGLLAKHTDIQERLREEILTFNSQELILENILGLTLLQNVIKESMRLYPAFPVLSRKAKEADTLGAYHIPKDTNVVIPIYVLQRSEKYFKDPLIFNPDRFFDPSIEKNYTFMPFSRGPRRCVAEQFAIIEISLVLIEILRHFKLQLKEKDLPKDVASVSLKPDGDFLVNLIKIKR